MPGNAGMQATYQTMNYLEIAGTLLGLLYLYLEYRANAWLWIVGIAMPAIYLKVYYDTGLYADLGISVYYILASLYGLGCWVRSRFSGGDAKEELRISPTPRSLIVPLSVIGLAVFFLIGWILSSYTDSTVPWADAFTTALSIVAMWMLARKYLEQWLVWIVADVACSALYLYKDLPFTAGLYLLYAIIAIFGYRKWKHIMLIENGHDK